ncbi:MAG: lipoprotein [Pseudomonadota bacterium]
MMRKTPLLVLLATCLAACGQTGDLYLPEPATGTPTERVPDTTTDKEDDDEKTPAG